MTWKQQIVKFFRSLGYDVTRYRPGRHPEARRMRLMDTYGIDLVLDVGANAGQYAEGLRAAGYKGRIASFEPLAEAFAGLATAANADSKWQVNHMALGATPGTTTIHVAGNSTSSSLLEMLPLHENAAPYSKYVGEQTVTIETLDRLFPALKQDAKSIWLKIDTQGFENQVLDGAASSLEHINTVQLEVSLAPLYDGSATLHELLATMKSLDYSVVGMDPGFCDKDSGRLLQADVTFHRY